MARSSRIRDENYPKEFAEFPIFDEGFTFCLVVCIVVKAFQHLLPFLYGKMKKKNKIVLKKCNKCSFLLRKKLKSNEMTPIIFTFQQGSASLAGGFLIFR